MRQLFTNNIVNDGLVVYLDAGVKGSYPSSGTTWTDLAKDNNGTLTNGPTFNSANGGSIVFDGSNDLVSLPTIATTSSFTFEAWARTTNSTQDQQYIYTKQRQPPDSGYQYSFQQMQGIYISYPSGGWHYITLNFASNDSKGTIFYTNTRVVQTNIWFQIAGTVDNGTTSLYLNGALSPSYQATDVNYSANTTPGIFTPNSCKIGGRYDADANSPFNGNIAIIRDYSRALTAAEVRQNFEATRHRFGI